LDALTKSLVEAAVTVFKPRDPILEIGSLLVQAGAVGDLRPMFAGRNFVGCDMQAGSGVDRVERLEALTLPDGWAGTVLCLNVFEHAWEFWKGAAEIARVTAPGGLAIITAPFEFHIHAYPDDYFRFTPRALARLMSGFESVIYGWQGHPKTPRLVFAAGLKAQRSDLAAVAEAWRRETLARWTEYPPLWDRFRAAVGGSLFGKRGFRLVKHWRELTLCPSCRAP
jgi:SAM-dependent methyltransferase